MDEVTELNSACQTKAIRIAKPNTTNIFTEIYTCEIWCYKFGNIVTVTLNVNAVMKSVSEYVTLFVIPEGYRPQTSVIVNYTTQSGEPMGICIQQNSGSFQLYNNNKDIVSGWLVRQSITYII